MIGDYMNEILIILMCVICIGEDDRYNKFKNPIFHGIDSYGHVYNFYDGNHIFYVSRYHK